MADNVAITAGAGTTIATDDVGTVHYQRVKIDLGGDGAASPLLAGQQAKTGSLPVTLASDEDNVNVDVSSLPNEGQQTMANSISVAVASDQSSLGTTPAGNVAHDAADSGNPLKVGGKAKNFDGTAPGTAVAEDDRVDFIADVYGRQLVETAHPNLWKANDNQSTAQTNTSLEAAPGAGLSLYVTDIHMSTDTAMNIKLVEDTAGTPADVAGPFYFAANGGMTSNLRTPIKLTANKNLGYTSSAAGNHTLTISGYIAP